jgi:cytochrome oxidase assembly protein ShyY1
MIRAPLWAWILTAAAVALFVSLGMWQVRRGLAKEGLQANLADRSAQPVILSAALGPPQGLQLHRAQATGRYLADRQLLQDGQSHQHRPGYHVWTPLLLPDESAVMVDRGWVPADRSGFDGTAPEGVITVTGFWRALPEPGIRLAQTRNCTAATQFPAIVLYPTPAEVECLMQRPVVGGLLLLDPEVPGGFVREWTDFGFPPQRHYGYAFQWFALALAAIGVFVAVNRKRTPGAA